MPTLNLPHQNCLCIGTKPAFSFWINISTVSEVKCDCQGLGLVACIEASILVFDTKPVLYWPVLGQIQICSFDRRCKTCLDTKPVLYQGRFCSLTDACVLGVLLLHTRNSSVCLWCNSTLISHGVTDSHWLVNNPSARGSTCWHVNYLISSMILPGKSFILLIRLLPYEPNIDKCAWVHLMVWCRIMIKPYL